MVVLWELWAMVVVDWVVVVVVVVVVAVSELVFVTTRGDCW